MTNHWVTWPVWPRHVFPTESSKCTDLRIHCSACCSLMPWRVATFCYAQTWWELGDNCTVATTGGNIVAPCISHDVTIGWWFQAVITKVSTVRTSIKNPKDMQRTRKLSFGMSNPPVQRNWRQEFDQDCLTHHLSLFTASTSMYDAHKSLTATSAYHIDNKLCQYVCTSIDAVLPRHTTSLIGMPYSPSDSKLRCVN